MIKIGVRRITCLVFLARHEKTCVEEECFIIKTSVDRIPNLKKRERESHTQSVLFEFRKLKVRTQLHTPMLKLVLITKDN